MYNTFQAHQDWRDHAQIMSVLRHEVVGGATCVSDTRKHMIVRCANSHVTDKVGSEDPYTGVMNLTNVDMCTRQPPHPCYH
jgi:hypothetical protein